MITDNPPSRAGRMIRFRADGIEPQLVAAPDQIAFRWYLDHVPSQEHLPAMQSLGKNNPGRFDVAP